MGPSPPIVTGKFPPKLHSTLPRNIPLIEVENIQPPPSLNTPSLDLGTAREACTTAESLASPPPHSPLNTTPPQPIPVATPSLSPRSSPEACSTPQLLPSLPPCLITLPTPTPPQISSPMACCTPQSRTITTAAPHSKLTSLQGTSPPTPPPPTSSPVPCNTPSPPTSLATPPLPPPTLSAALPLPKKNLKKRKIQDYMIKKTLPNSNYSTARNPPPPSQWYWVCSISPPQQEKSCIVGSCFWKHSRILKHYENWNSWRAQ